MPGNGGLTPDYVNTNAPTNSTLSNYCEQFTYDAIGNIDQVTHKDTCGSGGTLNWNRQYAYDTNKPNNYLQSTHSGTPPSSPEYTYDTHGNMLTMPHLSSLNWDFADQLKSTDKTDETTHYVYSGGQRVRKVVLNTSGTTDKIKYERIYLGAYELYRSYDVAEELDIERATHHIMDDSRKVAMLEVKTTDGGTEVSTPATITRYQYTNHLDTASLELDENAAVLSYEEYHPFGSTSYQLHTNDVAISLKRYKYSHKERDDETGMYYYGARYYAGWLCRFASVDPLKDEYAFQNSYAYAANSPITLTDVNGEGPGGGGEESTPCAGGDCNEQDLIKAEKIAQGIVAKYGHNFVPQNYGFVTAPYNGKLLDQVTTEIFSQSVSAFGLNPAEPNYNTLKGQLDPIRAEYSAFKALITAATVDIASLQGYDSATAGPLQSAINSASSDIEKVNLILGRNNMVNKHVWEMGKVSDTADTIGLLDLAGSILASGTQRLSRLFLPSGKVGLKATQISINFTRNPLGSQSLRSPGWQLTDDFISLHSFRRHRFNPSKASTSSSTQYGPEINVKALREQTIENADKVTKIFNDEGIHYATKYEKTFGFNISTNATRTRESRVFINLLNPEKSTQFPYFKQGITDAF